jgi:hypothetical protein
MRTEWNMTYIIFVQGYPISGPDYLFSGHSTTDGKSGWFGESGKWWNPMQKTWCN